MPKFRRKPIVIEAFQITKEHRDDNSEWPGWMHDAWNEPKYKIGAVYPRRLRIPTSSPDPLMMQTTQGPQEIDWNDWIIRDKNGELSLCKPDIFNKTYESLTEDNVTDAIQKAHVSLSNRIRNLKQRKKRTIDNRPIHSD